MNIIKKILQALGILLMLIAIFTIGFVFFYIALLAGIAGVG